MDSIFKQMMTEKGGDKINERGKNKWWPRLLIKIIMDKLSIDTDNCKMPIWIKTRRYQWKIKWIDTLQSSIKRWANITKTFFFYFNMFGLDQLTRMDVGTSSLTCPSLSKEKKIIYLCYLDPLRKAWWWSRWYESWYNRIKIDHVACIS